jgi:hypothetical protein
MANSGDAALAPWEKDGAPASRTAGMMVWGVLMVVTGVVALGAGGVKVMTEASTLQALASVWSAGGGSSLSVNLLVASSYVACVVPLFGVLGIVANKINNRPMAAAALVAVLLVSTIQIMSGILFQGTVKQAFGVLVPNPYSAGFSAAQLAFVDTGNAVYNQCCHARFINDTKITQTRKANMQDPIPECPSEKGLTAKDKRVCPPLPAEIDGILSSFGLSEVLCTCYSQASYNAILKFVKANDMCSKLQSTKVSVAGLQLPTTAISITINEVLSKTDSSMASQDPADKLSPYLPVKTMGMTGQIMPRDPWNDIRGVPASSGVEGFNCGFGYAKGVAWTQQVYIDQTGSLFALVVLLVGAVQLLASALVFIFWWMGGGSSSEEAWADYEKGAVSPAAKAPEM